MTVKELVKKLENFPPNAKVIVARDAEGNGFHELFQVEKIDAEDERPVLWPSDVNLNL